MVSAGAEASGLSGYHVDNDYRSAGAGVVTTLVPPPVKGAIQFYSPPPVTPVTFRGFDSCGAFITLSLVIQRCLQKIRGVRASSRDLVS